MEDRKQDEYVSLDEPLFQEVIALKEELELLKQRKQILTNLLDEESCHIPPNEYITTSKIELREVQLIKEYQRDLSKVEPLLQAYRFTGKSMFIKEGKAPLLGYRIDTFFDRSFQDVYYLFLNPDTLKIVNHTLPAKLDIWELQEKYLPNSPELLLDEVAAFLKEFTKKKYTTKTN